MDKNTQTDKQTKRGSRWVRYKLSENVKLTERDVDVFKLLARYRYLSTDYIHAFLKGDYQSLSIRLRKLWLAGYLQRPKEQRDHAEANYRKLVYELDNKAVKVLSEHGVSKPDYRGHSSFPHELMVCQAAASFELGTKEAQGVRIIRWPAIMASDKFPEATRKLPNPTSIPYAIGKTITPDSEPFVIARELGASAMSFFVGFEADCGTEPIRTSNPHRSAIENKYRAYLTIIDQGIHTKHFGARTIRIPFIASSESDMHSMMELLEQMATPEQAKHFLFKFTPTFYAYKKTPPPTGYMLTTPWKRTHGLPDVTLTQA